MRGAAILALIGGCGGGSTVTVHAAEAVLVAFQDGDGAFTAAPLADDGVYRFETDGRYSVARVCASTTGADVLVERSSVAEQDALLVPCGGQPPARLTVAAGDTTIIAACGSVSAVGAPVVLDVPEGTCDVVAVALSGVRSQVVVEHGVEVRGDTRVDVDFADVAMLRRVPLEVTWFSGGDRWYRSEITTERGTRVVVFDSNLADGYLAPSDWMRPGDRQAIVATSGNETHAAGARAILDREALDAIQPGTGPVELTVRGWPPDIALAIEDGAAVATFSEWPLARATFELEQIGAFDRNHALRITDGWVDDPDAMTTEVRFPILDGVDGWDPDWNLEPLTETRFDLAVWGPGGADREKGFGAELSVVP